MREGKGGKGKTHPESEFHSGGVKNRHSGLASQGRTGETSTVVPCLREGADGSKDDGDVGSGEFGGEKVSFSAAVTVSRSKRQYVVKIRGNEADKHDPASLAAGRRLNLLLEVDQGRNDVGLVGVDDEGELASGDEGEVVGCGGVRSELVGRGEEK